MNNFFVKLSTKFGNFNLDAYCVAFFHHIDLTWLYYSFFLLQDRLFLFWIHLAQKSVKVIGTVHRDRILRHILVECSLRIGVVREVMPYAWVVQPRWVLLRICTSCIWNCVATDNWLNSRTLIYVEGALIVIWPLYVAREYSLLSWKSVFVLQLFRAVLSALEIQSWTWVRIVLILSTGSVELLPIFPNRSFGAVVGARTYFWGAWICLRTHFYRMLDLRVFPIKTLVHWLNNENS